MLFIALLILVFPSITLGLNDNTLKFSINYFNQRHAPFVCLISCESVTWDVKFTKAASTVSMPVSRLNTDDLSYENIKQCFQPLLSIFGVLLNAQCEGVEHILNAASEYMWLDSMHIWLIIDETEDLVNYENITDHPINLEASINNTRTVQMLGDLNISVDADIILALKNDNQFILFDIFNFGKIQGGSLVITEIGTWNNEKENKNIVAELNGYKYYKRWDFGQSALRLISVTSLPPNKFDPILLTSVEPVAGISTITRTSTIILMVVAEIHNIRFVHAVTDRWLGTYEKNTTRVAAGALYYREQDLTSVFRIQNSIFDKISFIHPALTSLETRYYYRIPTTGPGKFENQFLRPLSGGVWCCVLAVAVLCAMILMLSAKLEARPSAAQYALFSVTASVCQQFFEDEIQTSRESAGVSCVLIYNYYTSSVVSWLLNGPPPSINSLDELLESPLELIYQDVGYTRSWLNTPGYYYNKRNAKSEDALKRKVLNKKKSTPIMQPLEEGIAMVKAGGYAYHTDTYSADTLISQTFDQSELCELGSLSSMEKTLLYPGVQKNSPYKEFLTWSLTRLQERGIISCVQRRTTPRPVSCEGSSPRALALGGAAPAFILLAIGFLLGTSIMLVERFVFEMKRTRGFGH